MIIRYVNLFARKGIGAAVAARTANPGFNVASVEETTSEVCREKAANKPAEGDTLFRVALHDWKERF